MTPSLCRDCGARDFAAAICPTCQSRRVIRHDELFTLTIAHIDCDAFYASVEKRDAPELAAKPVIVGGGRRGVVAACCYIARTRGVRSAMPMFKALAACPDAVVIRPNIAKYSAEGARIRTMMQRLTPLVEPMSIDEAVLDLSGTQALHGAPPAAVLAAFARDVEREVLPACDHFGLGFLPFFPLASGLLSGKYLGQATGRLKTNKMYEARYGEATNFSATSKVQASP